MKKIKYTLLISALFAMTAFSFACASEDSSEASSSGGSNTLQQVLDGISPILPKKPPVLFWSETRAGVL